MTVILLLFTFAFFLVIDFFTGKSPVTEMPPKPEVEADIKHLAEAA